MPSLKKGEHNLGTTIMAVEFDGGVIIAADSRTTTGSYIANRVTDKLTPLVHPYIYCCRSGSAADTQALADIVSYNLEMTSIQNGEIATVHNAAVLFRKMCYQYKDSLMAGLIVAGYDASRNAGSVYNVPLGGSLHKAPFAIGGSGSTYIYGYCDAAYKENMTKNECIEFVTHAVSLAMERDGSSGGVIRLGIITKDGIERRIVSGEQLPKHWEN